jgi:hypothetical protein
MVGLNRGGSHVEIEHFPVKDLATGAARSALGFGDTLVAQKAYKIVTSSLPGT